MASGPDSPTRLPRLPAELESSLLEPLLGLASAFLRQESELPPRDIPVEKLRQQLGIALPSDGRPLTEVVDRLGRVLSATPSAASPRFLNQLFGGRDPVATLAEMLVALSNTSMYTFKVAGAQVLVEQEVLSRMLTAVGFPDGEGAFSPGGSLANLTALLLSRNEAVEGAREKGLGDQQLTAYTSVEGHYSIPKAAGILGLGRASVRRVPTDAYGAMRVGELEHEIVADRAAGRVPLFINATAGTTVLGAVDPIAAMADVATRHGLWLHVDGALAGSAVLSTRYRSLVAGCERADSFTWNAHKMMGVPLPCSVLLLRRKGLLARHLGESAGYLFQADDEELNPGTRSLQCGRRNDALKLWAAWQLHGDRGYDRRLTGLLDTARLAADLVRRDPAFELLHEPHSTNVCFAVHGCAASELCDFLDRQGMLKIGHGTVAGRSAVRLVCVDPELDEVRIRQVLGLIKDAAGQLATRSASGPQKGGSPGSP